MFAIKGTAHFCKLPFSTAFPEPENALTANLWSIRRIYSAKIEFVATVLLSAERLQMKPGHVKWPLRLKDCEPGG
jgi:hypothetical protein